MAKKAKTEKQKKPGYWQSKPISDLIVTRMSNYSDWLVPEGQQPWQALRADVVRSNSKGRRKGSPRNGRVFMEDIEYDDGNGHYPRLRVGLFLFADLLIRFHKRISKQYGKDYLDQVRLKFRSDPKATTFLVVYETHIGSRSALVNALEQIGRKGIDFKTVGGINGGYRDRDCGIEPLVVLTGAIERRLKSLSNEKRKAQKVAVNRIDPNTRPQVIVEYLENGKLKLWYQKKSVILSGLQAKLVTQLFDPNTKKVVPYRELWKALYPKLSYTSKDTGPPERLKTLKMDLQRKLTETFDEPPHKSIWILAEKNVGYSLNYRIVNWRHAKVFSRTRAMPMDPGVLDSIVVRDKYG